MAECGCGGGPQVWTYSAECASKMRDEQDSLDLALFIGIDWSNMHNKRSQRSICNISRFTSCGPNNLGGKWVMTVALGPDTLTMFDGWPKGWGDDHLNDHTTERNTMESSTQNLQPEFGLPVSQLGNYIYQLRTHMYGICTYICMYSVYTQYYSHSLVSRLGSFECITHLSL